MGSSWKAPGRHQAGAWRGSTLLAAGDRGSGDSAPGVRRFHPCNAELSCHHVLLLSISEGIPTQVGWSQWVQRGQSVLLGAQRLEEAGLGGPMMGQ